MLHNISWADYITAIGLAMLLYYIAVILLYYRDEAIGFIRREPSPLSPGTSTLAQQAASKEEIFDGLESVVADLITVLRKAGKDASKEEVLSQLRQRLENYAGLPHPAFRKVINNNIITHAAAHCGLQFDERELNQVWDSI